MIIITAKFNANIYSIRSLILSIKFTLTFIIIAIVVNYKFKVDNSIDKARLIKAIILLINAVFNIIK